MSTNSVDSNSNDNENNTGPPEETLFNNLGGGNPFNGNGAASEATRGQSYNVIGCSNDVGNYTNDFAHGPCQTLPSLDTIFEGIDTNPSMDEKDVEEYRSIDEEEENYDISEWGANIDEVEGGGGDIDTTQPAADATEYRSFYSCTAASTEELEKEGNEELPIQFEYEMYTAPDADVDSVLSSFERQLNDGVASSMGLNDCATFSDNGGGMIVVNVARNGGSRSLMRRTLQKRVETNRLLDNDAESKVVGVSADPVDEPQDGE